MQVTMILPNQNGSSGLAYGMPQSHIRASLNLPSQGRRQPTIPESTTDPARRNLAEDAYEISTTGKSLLRSTFTSTESRRPVYDVTTDLSSQNRATTILWRFDREERKVTEVARINWSVGKKTMVEMGGVCVAVTELLTKSKWRLGMSSCVSRAFTSQMEEYRWIPQHTLFNVDSCTWKCVIPIPSGNTPGLTVLSVYTPFSLREPLQPSNSSRLFKRNKPTSSARRPPTSGGSTRDQYLHPQGLSDPGKRERQAAVLEMYQAVNSKPHLREIVLLTTILVVVRKDEWKSLPRLSAYTTTSDLVLSRLSETDGPKHRHSIAIDLAHPWVSSRPVTAAGMSPPKLSLDYPFSIFGGGALS